MVLTDTHTHLYGTSAGLTVEELIDRAEKNEIRRFFLPNIDEITLSRVFEIAETYPQCCFPMAGLHPVHVDEDYARKVKTIQEGIRDRKIFAVGEVGLDLFHDKTFFAQQQEAFIIQAEWATALGLPVVIHCRNAFAELMDLLQRLPRMSGIFHCFTGSLDEAKKIIDMGFYLGIGGVVTYKNSGLDRVVKDIDLSHIVLETDSPYLSPAPLRGKTNESANLIYVADKVAAIKNLTVDEVATVTTENSKKIFGI